jgi:hypothetical protein
MEFKIFLMEFTFQSPAMHFVGEIRFHFVICRSNLFYSFKIKTMNFKFN